ncbi:hypothetical protein CTA2_591 [Colletotrichum tanaceti]|uniref:Uncharacterized protein n=1 Tax=Colletotrichum tanaceti TaxID=1306861 RepID=A0A4V6DHK6_9PEZI|nr:hypothetical protein CTA2_591 [Colletotrichum tanaceti]TKW56876.1 hypothetical protein CTA1_11275 [Colletotrichum tanaceti]
MADNTNTNTPTQPKSRSSINPEAEPFVPRATAQRAGQPLVVLSYGYRQLLMPKPATFGQLLQIAREKFSIPYPTRINILLHLRETYSAYPISHETFNSVMDMDSLLVQTRRDVFLFISNRISGFPPAWFETALTIPSDMTVGQVKKLYATQSNIDHYELAFLWWGLVLDEDSTLFEVAGGDALFVSALICQST